MSSGETVLFAALVGLVPSVAMFVSSVWLLNYSLNPRLEAAFQNLAGGLLLGAVAAELFPMLADISRLGCAIGEFIGFSTALCVVYGVEPLIEAMFPSNEEQEERSIEATAKSYFVLTNDSESGTQSTVSNRGKLMANIDAASDCIDMVSMQADEIRDSSSFQEERKLCVDADEQVSLFIFTYDNY